MDSPANDALSKSIPHTGSARFLHSIEASLWLAWACLASLVDSRWHVYKGIRHRFLGKARSRAVATQAHEVGTGMKLAQVILAFLV